MYNDYYLQEINNKLVNLEEIIENQEAIIENQQQLISGDKEIKTNQEASITMQTIEVFIIAILLIYKFIERCFR